MQNTVEWPITILYFLTEFENEGLVSKEYQGKVLFLPQHWTTNRQKQPLQRFTPQGPFVQSPIKLILDFNYLFKVKGGLFTRLRFKENKFVIYNPIGPQFCGKPAFSGK